MRMRHFGLHRSNLQRIPGLANTAIAGALCILMTLLAVAPVHADESDTARNSLSPRIIELFGEPPLIPEGPTSPELTAALDAVFIEGLANSVWDDAQSDGMRAILASEDPRVSWLLADMLRFVNQPELGALLVDALSSLLGLSYDDGNYWGLTTDHLMAWDIPAPDDYLRYKRAIFTSFVPGWEDIFVPGDIDWRFVSWGGVLIDDRPYGTTDEPCNCIPAADNPAVSTAEEATWLGDDDIVFGVSVNGEHRAYPRQIMEVREMVNDTLGGRDLGIPYCTLCGAAQAYFTDGLPDGIERPVLRTSGLLIRSNKVMYDITSSSVFDTFRGNAVTGPLAEKQITLEQANVITTRWGSWKEAHPETTVLLESLALGRDFDFRNNRDANGPIFPIGDVDPRLPVHEDVVGVVGADGQAFAFTRSAAMSALLRGDDVETGGIQLVLNGGGIEARSKDGRELGSHEAFWFAWSQFHPTTRLWPG